MQAVTIVIRSLLGLVFLIFGVNAFLHFIPLPMPTGDAGTFMGILVHSHYLYAVKAFEIVGGAILLSGRFTPLGLTLIGPVIVNIIFYDVFLDPIGLPLGLIIAACELFLIYRHRSAFSGIIAQ
jgi:putative oxidoreductase